MLKKVPHAETAGLEAENARFTPFKSAAVTTVAKATTVRKVGRLASQWVSHSAVGQSVSQSVGRSVS